MRKVQLHNMINSYQSQFSELLYQASCRQLYSSHTILSQDGCYIRTKHLRNRTQRRTVLKSVTTYKCCGPTTLKA